MDFSKEWSKLLLKRFWENMGLGDFAVVSSQTHIKPYVFFLTNKNKVRRNILKDFGKLFDNHLVLWNFRAKEDQEDYMIDGKEVDYGLYPSKYILTETEQKPTFALTETQHT